MKVIKNLQHFGTHITNRKNMMVIHIFNMINNVNLWKFFLIIVSFYISGVIINFYIPFPCFWLFQNLFISIFIIAFFSIRYFQTKMKELRRMTAGDKTLHFINDKINRLQYSALNLIVPPIACFFFGCLAILLVNVNIKLLSGYYLILTYTSCVLISFLGYLQYIYLFIYIIKIGRKKEIYKYDEDYPSNTEWLTALAKLYCRYRNTFFILGMLYVFGVIYFVLCKDFNVIEKIKTFPEFKIVLFLFWGGVLCAIVIIFPIVSSIEYIYIRKIVDNLKEQSVLKINKSIFHDNDIRLKLEKANLVIAIRNTPDYPFKDALGIIFSSLVSCINLVTSISAIFQLGIW